MRLTFDQLSSHLARFIAGRCAGKPIFIAVDGPDCSGKSTLSRSLVGELKNDFPVVLIHFDDYLNPKHRREHQGEFSIEGFLYDYFDEKALIKSVLVPARQDLSQPPYTQVIIVEGLFLLRPTLAPYFDVRFRLEIEDDLILERAYRRDVGALGSEVWVKRHYNEQCLPAQRFYRNSIAPQNLADIVVKVVADNAYEVSS